jgi:hypothetical protein
VSLHYHAAVICLLSDDIEIEPNFTAFPVLPSWVVGGELVSDVRMAYPRPTRARAARSAIRGQTNLPLKPPPNAAPWITRAAAFSIVDDRARVDRCRAVAYPSG